MSTTPMTLLLEELLALGWECELDEPTLKASRTGGSATLSVHVKESGTDDTFAVDQHSVVVNYSGRAFPLDTAPSRIRAGRELEEFYQEACRALR